MEAKKAISAKSPAEQPYGVSKMASHTVLCASRADKNCTSDFCGEHFNVISLCLCQNNSFARWRCSKKSSLANQVDCFVRLMQLVSDRVRDGMLSPMSRLGKATPRPDQCLHKGTPVRIVRLEFHRTENDLRNRLQHSSSHCGVSHVEWKTVRESRHGRWSSVNSSKSVKFHAIPSEIFGRRFETKNSSRASLSGAQGTFSLN